MNHIMKPFDKPLDAWTRVRRTQNSCPCDKCRTWRRNDRETFYLERSKTYAFELHAYAHIDPLLEALIADEVSG